MTTMMAAGSERQALSSGLSGITPAHSCFAGLYILSVAGHLITVLTVLPYLRSVSILSFSPYWSPLQISHPPFFSTLLLLFPRILPDYSMLPLPSPCPHVQTSVCLYLLSRPHSLPRLPLCPFIPPHALGLLETLSLSFPARGNSCSSFLPVSCATICFCSSLCRYTSIAMATRRWRAPSKGACSGTGAKTCRTCPSLCSMSH